MSAAQHMKTGDSENRAHQLINNRYRVERQLGSGGMGDVYLVADTLLAGKLCALKSIKMAILSKTLIRSFKREFEVMSRLTEKCTSEQLEVQIKAGAGSRLGAHTVRVTTPAGVAHNPPGMAFEVQEARAGAETS